MVFFLYLTTLYSPDISSYEYKLLYLESSLYSISIPFESSTDPRPRLASAT